MTMLRLAALLLLVCFPHVLRAAEPFARAEVLTKGRIVAGQQIEIAIDVFAPNFFKSAPEFPLFELKDAIVTLPDQRALNMVDTVDGVEYSGIRKSYMVMAERPGSFALPVIKIPVAYATDAGGAANGTAMVPSVAFAADGVPGDWGGQAPLVATKVLISQELDRDPATLKVGDALVRRVSVLADDTQPMMIPVPNFAAPAGTKVYRTDPELGQRGSAGDDPDAARRTETVTYVAEKAGTITLPPVEIRWFDSVSGRIETASAPDIKITVKENPAPAQVIPAGSAPQADLEVTRRGVNHLLFQTLLLGLAALILFALAYLLLGKLSERWEEMKRRKAESEPAYFHKVNAALSGNEPLAAWRALDAWAKRLGFRSISDWAMSLGQGELDRALNHFQRTLYGADERDEQQNAMAELNRCLLDARRISLSGKSRAAPARHTLPPLNP
ncbi:BatD family protein [Rhizobium sp. KVB221]|uniref:BatD family protein n=1 Tax=Rhizobium setariae TaxID=2801340 RepID=A0A936YJK9_9HYPH|nr:BatD family protein [Rhizobium setariae]MBL0371534.1 BatD family protein [Rhizobium setariae]